MDWIKRRIRKWLEIETLKEPDIFITWPHDKSCKVTGIIIQFNGDNFDNMTAQVQWIEYPKEE